MEGLDSNRPMAAQTEGLESSRSRAVQKCKILKEGLKDPTAFNKRKLPSSISSRPSTKKRKKREVFGKQEDSNRTTPDRATPPTEL
ncbi:hypothetical protein TNCT_68491 [Trichonephila clavata]|uniref:Uncharacterized protein n=1 Tax=Trichonephila clavata TaxID=2740835 RepID=A0A8X6L580_TRICU|nr:hypothetical protein TNCT_68491 [Trichonephila clavata]